MAAIQQQKNTLGVAGAAPMYEFQFMAQVGAYDQTIQNIAQRNPDRTFQIGEKAIGTMMPGSPTAKSAPMVLIEGKYAVPLSAVKKVRDVGPSIPESMNILSQAEKLKNSEGFKIGALIGTIGGGIYALVTGKTFLVYALVGLVGGGVVGHIITNKKKS